MSDYEPEVATEGDDTSEGLSNQEEKKDGDDE